MKSRDSALRLKRFDAAEKARKISDLEAMIREFEQMAVDLDRQIAAEEDRTGVRDRNHFAYSTFAQSALLRRDNLANSVANLKLQLESARGSHAALLEELARLEAAEPREAERSRAKSERNGAHP